MNKRLSATSIVLEDVSRSTIIPKRNPPLTAKTDKCIKFVKEEGNWPLSERDLCANPNDIPIDLNQVIEKDTPYGHCQRKESLDCSNSKKRHMLQDDYFSSTVDKYQLIDMQKLPEYFLTKEEEEKREIDSIFEVTLLDTKKVEATKKKLNDFHIEKAKGPIGPLTPCDALIVLMNVNNKAIKQTFEEMKREIKMCRFVLNDANSFYRAFMLGLFEHHILFGNLLEIKQLILGIFRKIKLKQFNRHNTPIRLHEVSILLYLIYSDVIRGKTKAAYDLLLKAINTSTSFDYSLIKFMRIAIGEYIETNADSIFKSESWEEIEQIAAPCYLSNHCFDYKSYINDRILAMHFEADKFIIQIAPVVFRINLDLYAIEGTANEVKHLIYLKQNYHYISSPSIYNSISLFYSFSRYHKLYSIDYMKHNNIHITYRSLKSKDADSSLDRFRIVNSKYQCAGCEGETMLICFNHISRANFCKKCLITAIDRIIVKRISHFIDEYYNNKEYYFRFVALTENFEDKLYEEDFIALFNRNIPQQILHTMERLCYKCFKGLEKGYETMPCECKMCHECLIDNILEATDQKIVLNQYEKVDPLLRKVYCPCENSFDVDKAIELVYRNKDKVQQLNKEAMVRLHKAVEVICAFCGLLHKRANYSKVIDLNTDTVKNDYLNVIRFSIIKDKNPLIANCRHIICKNCIKDLKQEIRNKMQKGEIGDKDNVYPLNCKVCLYTHKIDEKVLKAHKRTDCCLII